MTRMPISRLIRFVAAEDSRIYYGAADEKLQAAEILSSDSPFSGESSLTGQRMNISRILCPLDIAHCRGIVCVGLNYTDHAKEAKMAIPTVPVIFHKPITALTGPYDDLVIPKLSWEKGKLDYEAELVIVIGKEAFQVTKEAAMGYVYGFTAGNDISNRKWQFEPALSGGQWCFSKSFDHSTPIGPVIVSREDVQLAAGLPIRGILNGELMQNSNTRNMIFSATEIVSFLSQGMTLLPGTLIFTGTPAGVGFGRAPKVFVKEHDILEVEIGGIGRIQNRILFGN